MADYREHRPDAHGGARAIVACTWEHLSLAQARARVVPDACSDVVWDGRRLSLAGPDTRPVYHMLEPGTRILGLRIVPGAAGALLGVPASAVRDAQVELSELWGDDARRLEEQLRQAASAQAGRRALEQAVVQRLRAAAPVDDLIGEVVRALRPTDEVSVPSVVQLATRLGVSERQLRRRCDAALGYGPKLLARVLRFQAFMTRLRSGAAPSLAELAVALGYVDQAHLAHDVAALAGTTPAQLRAEAHARRAVD